MQQYSITLHDAKLIDPNDLLIAAHALANDLTVVTENIREFTRVPGLKTENWLQSTSDPCGKSCD